MQKFQPRLSPKEIATYQALSSLKRKASALEIAQVLNSPTPHVYRYLEQLEQLGLIFRHNERPVTFEAIPPLSALENFLTFQEVWFCQTFPTDDADGVRPIEPVISFYRNRDELIAASTSDIASAHYSASLMVSGQEIPAETILAQKQAIKFGVQIKILVQDHHHENFEMFKNWTKLGVEVRLAENFHTRLYLYDDSIAYLAAMSDNPEKAMGVRILSTPINQFLTQLFQQYWHQSVEI